MRYYINYGTGRGNEFVNGTIEEAQRAAEEGWPTPNNPLCFRQMTGRT